MDKISEDRRRDLLKRGYQCVSEIGPVDDGVGDTLPQRVEALVYIVDRRDFGGGKASRIDSGFLLRERN